MCKEGTLSLSAWCKGPQATPPDQCHHASPPDEPHVSTKFQQIFTFPTICPILLNIGIRWGGEDEKHIEVDYIFFRKDASDGVGRFFTRSSLCRVKMLARPQISVFYTYQVALLKKTKMRSAITWLEMPIRSWRKSLNFLLVILTFTPSTCCAKYFWWKKMHLIFYRLLLIDCGQCGDLCFAEVYPLRHAFNGVFAWFWESSLGLNRSSCFRLWPQKHSGRLSQKDCVALKLPYLSHQ